MIDSDMPNRMAAFFDNPVPRSAERATVRRAARRNGRPNQNPPAAGNRTIGLGGDDAGEWPRRTECRRSLELLRRVLPGLDAGHAPVCTAEEAERLARDLAAMMAKLRINVAEAAAEKKESPDYVPPEFQRKQDRRDRRLLTMFGSPTRGLGNRDHVAAILGGRKETAPKELKRLRGLLATMEKNMGVWMKVTEGVVGRDIRRREEEGRAEPARTDEEIAKVATIRQLMMKALEMWKGNVG